MNPEFIVTAVDERLLRFLQQRDNRHALVIGAPGSGKTSRLAYVAEQLTVGGAAVVTINARAEPSIDGLVAQIARAIDSDESLSGSYVRAVQASLVFRPILQHIQNVGRPAFLFIDSLDTIQERGSLASLLDNLLLHAQGILRVVLASRPISVIAELQRSSNVETFEELGLDNAHAEAFLEHAAGTSIPREALSNILDFADGNPRTLRIIAGLVKNVDFAHFSGGLPLGTSARQDFMNSLLFDLTNRSRAEKALLGCLAVFEFVTPQQIREVTGLGAIDVDSALLSLRRRFEIQIAGLLSSRLSMR